MSHLHVPIEECGEPLVDVAAEGGLLYGPPPETPATAPDYRWLRRSVHAKLLRVQQQLPAGLRLRLYEGLRSAHVQRRLFEEEKARVAAAHPGLAPREVHDRATLLISPPEHFDGTPNIPPHTTGAAVDIEVVDSRGQVLDFGMEAKDWVRFAPQFCETRHPGASPAARANRAMLCEAMEAQGFANYWREWWHYSHGDRYWAWLNGAPKAIYGPVQRPASE